MVKVSNRDRNFSFDAVELDFPAVTLFHKIYSFF